MHSDHQWKPVNSSSKYRETYNKILELLNSCEGKGNIVESRNFPDIKCGSLNTRIIQVESERICTVVYCTQYDTDTNSLRYLVYGTSYNEDCDYGIGIALGCPILIKFAEKHYPGGNMAKYLD